MTGADKWTGCGITEVTDASARAISVKWGKPALGLGTHRNVKCHGTGLGGYQSFC